MLRTGNNKSRIHVIAVIAAFIYSPAVMAQQNPEGSSPDSASHAAIKSQLPDPPAGFRWVLNEPYSDEFNGSELDREKWHDHYPGWEGRVPGKFVPSSLTVRDGYLQIKSTILDPPQGDFTIACGAVQTKANQAHYGYYECRMKASSVATSSTFWLKNPHDRNSATYLSTELDIQESIGNAQRWPSFGNHMMSNTHVELRSNKVATAEEATSSSTKRELVGKSFKKGNRVALPGRVCDDFYTFGCWWVDANTLKFYLNGKYVYTIIPSTEADETPFDQPMFVNLVCEIYTWEVLPKRENLLDDSRNTTYYDYVRAYKLVAIE